MLYENCVYTLRTDWSQFNGIVSQDFLCLQRILMDRIGVPDVPLKVIFLNLLFHIVFKVLSLHGKK